MVIEILFLGPDTTCTLAMHPSNSTDRIYSVVEENAIYYAAGYVLRKVLKKYHEKHDDMGDALICYHTAWHDRGECIKYRMFCIIFRLRQGMGHTK